MLSSAILTSLLALSSYALPSQLVFASDEPADLSKYTIYEILNYSLHHGDAGPGHPPHFGIGKLARFVINNSSQEVKDILDDKHASLTLFAPDDEALKPPEHHKHGEFITDVDELAQQRHHPFHSAHHHEEDPEKRKIFVKIVSAILKYHIADSKLEKQDILDKSTIETLLDAGRNKDDEAFRIRAESKFEALPLPPSYNFKLNFYATGRPHPPIIAKNGIIHLISHPLIPPFTPFTELLLFPGVFSTLTSATQQVELDSQLAPWLHGDKQGIDEVMHELMEDHYSPPEFTIFAPGNKAFFGVPFKLKLFLFSPFGRRALKFLLAGHVVPNTTFHSDYIHVAGKAHDEPKPIQFHKSDLNPLYRSFDQPDAVNVTHYELPTLLGESSNTTLKVDVVTYHLPPLGKGPLVRRIYVKGAGNEKATPVLISDGVNWKGATHVIPSLLLPHFEHHHGGDHEEELMELVRTLA